MMGRVYWCAAGLVTSLVWMSICFAECVPSDDPCAPKKVLGQWEKSISAGFNLTDGNSETMLLNLGFGARKDDNSNVWDFKSSYDYGEDERVEGPNDNTTRNEFRFAGQYDRIFSERYFGGFGTTFLYDEIADVDYRVVLNPAVGMYFVRDGTFKLRAEAGPSYVFERQGREDNNYLAPRVAERFEWALTCTSKLYQLAEVLFDASDSENYIINAELGVEAALTTTLALVLTVRDTYDNVPAPDREENDLAFITSLKVLL